MLGQVRRKQQIRRAIAFNDAVLGRLARRQTRAQVCAERFGMEVFSLARLWRNGAEACRNWEMAARADTFLQCLRMGNETRGGVSCRGR